MKKCPPGVICVENITLFLLIIILLVLAVFIYTNSQSKQNITINETDHIRVNTDRSIVSGSNWFPNWLPSWPYTNLPGDPLINPYAPPLRDERYFVTNPGVVGTVPINVSTNIGAVDTNYRQMGILTPLNGTTQDNILPLMGRPLFTNRDKWQYYTISNQHNNVKLPISFKGRSALNDYGVDQIYDGDTVYVEGYNDAYKATVYENNTIKYLPFV